MLSSVSAGSESVRGGYSVGRPAIWLRKGSAINAMLGAILIVFSLGGVLIHLGLALRDLVSLAAVRAEAEKEPSLASRG